MQATSLLISQTSVCWGGMLWAVFVMEESPPFKTPLIGSEVRFLLVGRVSSTDS